MNNLRQQLDEARRGKNDSPENNARIKEERRLRGIEQKYNQIQQDYDKLWN